MTSDVLEGTTLPALQTRDDGGSGGTPSAGRSGSAQGSAQAPAVEKFGFGQRAFGLALGCTGVVLGLALGVADVAATGTDMALRTPALLAALLLVGQGVLDVVRFGRGHKKANPLLSPAVPIVLLLLAVWLGLGLLQHAAPAGLVTLSLISAFVLFTLGWSLLRDKT